MSTPTHILVPTDGSDHACRAAAFAVSLAASTGAEVTVLHVVQLTPSEAIGMARNEDEDFHHQLAEMGRPVLQHTGEAMGAPPEPLRIQEVVEVGHAADVILGYASSHHVDLIVMGSRGRSALQHLLLGSVSDKVVRRAGCPVTIVR